MSYQNKSFVTFAIDRLNSLVTSLYEHLMDDEYEEARGVIEEAQNELTDLKETIAKDEF